MVVALREVHLDARGWLVAALVIGAVALEPVWQNLSFGQVNLVLMAAVVADLTRPERRFSGVLVGLAAAVKLTPLVFVVLLLLVGRRGAAGRAALTFLATVAVGFAVAPGAAASYWTLGLLDADRVGPPWLAHNQSAYGVLTRLLGESPSAYSGSASRCRSVARCCFSRRRGGVAATGCSAPDSPGSRCCSPRRSPGRTTGCGPSPSRSRSGRTVAGWRRRWTAVFVARPVLWPPWGERRELAWGFVDHLAGNAYVLAAVGLVVWAAARLGQESVEPDPSHSSARIA